LSLRITVDVEYARELATRLRSEFPESLDNFVSGSVRDVAERTLDTARSLTPVRTGFLLSTEALEQRADAKWVFHIVARAYYAAYVEFGTRRMAPRLFMTRAFEMHQQEFITEAENAVARAIEDTLS